MKITGGLLRGRNIAAARGRAMRPTAALLREALFNIIGAEIEGCRFLDLFAGSGSVGLEALSRGAATAAFVDGHRTSIGLIRRNLAGLGLESRSLVLHRDALKVLPELSRKGLEFDLAFIDPPYETDLAQRCLRSPRWRAIMPGRGRIFVEHRRGLALLPPPGLMAADSRNFGETMLTVFKGEEEK